MLTLQEIELLASLLARAGANPIEATWANSILDRLRSAALKELGEQDNSTDAPKQ